MSNFRLYDTENDVMEFYINEETTGGMRTVGTNVVGGRDAGDALTSGSADNILVGVSAGSALTTGLRNLAIGNTALAVVATGDDNIAIGDNALIALNAAISDNTVVGSNAAVAMTTGTNNVIVGAAAADAATTSDQCVIIGSAAVGTGVLTGNDNIVIGFGAGNAMTSSASSVIVGSGAGDLVTTGGNQVLLGHDAGNTITTGTGNICIGHSADVDAAAAVDRLALGRGTTATVNAQMVLGNTTVYTAGSILHGSRHPVVLTTDAAAPANDLTVAQSGSMVRLVAMTTATRVINLPAVASSAGVCYEFILTATAGQNIDITVADGNIVGQISTVGANNNVAVLIGAAATILRFIGAAVVGNTATLYCDGANWYLNAFEVVNGNITTA